MSVRFTVNTAEIAMVAATLKTVLQVSPAADQKITIASWGVSFDGIIVTEEPALVQLVRSTSAGTGAGSPPVGRPLDDDFGGTIQTTVAHNFSAEPTLGSIVDSFTVHPQGLYQVWFPMGWEPKVSLEAGTADWLNIVVTAPAAVDVIAKLFVEE